MVKALEFRWPAPPNFRPGTRSILLSALKKTGLLLSAGLFLLGESHIKELQRPVFEKWKNATGKSSMQDCRFWIAYRGSSPLLPSQLSAGRETSPENTSNSLPNSVVKRDPRAPTHGNNVGLGNIPAGRRFGSSSGQQGLNSDASVSTNEASGMDFGKFPRIVILPRDSPGFTGLKRSFRVLDRVHQPRNPDRKT